MTITEKTMKQQDVLGLYCGTCGTRESAPVLRVLSNVSRDTARDREKALESPSVSEHVERHGPAKVLTCADLHEAGGLDLFSHARDSLVDKGRGRPPVCAYEVHLLGGFEVPEDFTAARTSLLLPHWHRGCRMLQFAMDGMADDVEARPGFGSRKTSDARCDLCDFHEVNLFSRHAALIGMHHTATGHKVGEAACSVVACLQCEQGTVVTHELGAPVGTPRWCTCDLPVFWGRRLL